MLFTIVLLFCCNAEVYTENPGARNHKPSSDFAAMLNAQHFIDKTKMIRDFYLAKPSAVVITAPPKFGKTTNMDMVRRFFQIQTDSDGAPLAANETHNFKLFSRGYKTRRNNRVFLEINKPKYSQFFSQHFAKYPVILLDFKSLCSDSFDRFLDSFRVLVANAFTQHGYLLNSSLVSEIDKDKFKKFQDIEKITKLHPIYLQGSLKFLTSILFTHFDNEVMVFIDNYDEPLVRTIFEAGSDLIEIDKYIRKCVSNLIISNPLIVKALLNARVWLTPALSKDANILTHFNFTEKHAFNQYYGITEEEINRVARRCKMGNKMANITEWYGGYRIVHSHLRVYNIYSVVKYLQSELLQHYWMQTESVLISRLERVLLNFEVRKVVEKLVYNQTVKLSPFKMSLHNIIQVKHMINNPKHDGLSHADVVLFINFMFDMGYLSVKKIKRSALVLRIPNQEIRSEISRVYLKKYYTETQIT